MTREEAIEWLKAIEEKYIHGGDDGFDAKRKEAISMAIKALDQEPKWIFVSERVPDKNGKYLVTRYGNILGSSVCILCYAENLYNIDSFDFNKKKGKSGWYDYDSECGHFSRDDVIAWMPLPEPYKAESEGKHG